MDVTAPRLPPGVHCTKNPLAVVFVGLAQVPPGSSTTAVVGMLVPTTVNWVATPARALEGANEVMVEAVVLGVRVVLVVPPPQAISAKDSTDATVNGRKVPTFLSEFLFIGSTILSAQFNCKSPQPDRSAGEPRGRC